MSDLASVAPKFIAMAHKIVWCNVATVDKQGRLEQASKRTGTGWV